MLIIGTIEEVENYKVKIKELESNQVSEWLYVPQIYTKDSKSGYIPEKGVLAAAILTEDMSTGVLIGALYNDEDKIVEEFSGSDFIKFKEGAYIKHNKQDNSLEFFANKLKVLNDIDCTGDIKDKKGTLDSVREHSNTHKHANGNNGADTAAPTSQV